MASNPKKRRRGQDDVDQVAKAPRLPLPGESILVSLAAVFKRVSQKELHVKSGLPYKTVNNFLTGRGKADPLELLNAIACRPAEIRILGACIEAWAGLDTEYFSDAELDFVEMEVAEAARQHRRELKLALRGGRPRGKVSQRDLAGERLRAEEMRQGLAGLDSAAQRATLVKAVGRYHDWSFAEACVEWSLWQVSKNARSAIEWAELGCLAAERMPDDPSGLTAGAVRGYCGAHLANALRIQGELPRSEAEMLSSLERWESGADPSGLLDPGRVYELAASLRKDQRRPAEALRLLAKAAPVSRRPAHLMLQRGITLSMMGGYEEAVAVLVEAGWLVEAQGDARLSNVRRFSLSSALCHLGRHEEAAVLVPEIRRSAADLGDELDLHRALWLEGRIARGVGEWEKALQALETAAAAFESRGMDYDAALARFEAATLHLEMRRSDVAAEIAGELVTLLAAKGVNEEATKALKLFGEAIATQSVTAELAHSILRYLYLAQHQILVFIRK